MEDCIKKWNVAEASQDCFLPEETKPWERSKKLHKEDTDGSLRLTLANRIYIETGNLKPRLQNQLRRMAAISNPLFYRNRAMGLSNFSSSRYLYLGEDDGGFLCCRIATAVIHDAAVECVFISLSKERNRFLYRQKQSEIGVTKSSVI